MTTATRGERDEAMLFVENERLVYWVLHRMGYREDHPAWEDLCQEARIGLLKALRVWDRARPFSSLAVACIENAVRMAYRKVHQPRHIPPEALWALDLPYQDEEGHTATLADLLGADEEGYATVEWMGDWVAWWDQISAQDRATVKAAWATQAQRNRTQLVGACLGLSQSMASRRMRKARAAWRAWQDG